MRWVVNLWLVFHLVAIIIAPAAMDPSSELARSDMGRVPALSRSPCTSTTATTSSRPSPRKAPSCRSRPSARTGPSSAGESRTERRQPRLLYHRYFMLTEHMKQSPEEFRDRWHESYAQHLGREYGASRVKLIQQTHLLSSMERIREGGRLTDPESYEDHPLGDFPMRRLLNPVVRDLTARARSLAGDWDAFWFTTGRSHPAGAAPDPDRPDAALHARRLGSCAGSSSLAR